MRRKIRGRLLAILLAAGFFSQVSVCEAKDSWISNVLFQKTASTEDEFIQAVYEGMLAGEEEIKILYLGPDFKNIHDTFLDSLLDCIFEIDNPDTSDDFDYMKYNLDEVGIRTKSDFLNLVTITISPKWKESKEETAFVNQKVDEIIKELDLDGDTEYVKIKKVHDYIVQNFDYDEELNNYTVYDGMKNGTMICQGYMLLTYKLLTEAGIPVKCIDGTGSNSFGTQTHGWNLVELSGYWYNLDTTWDDPILIGADGMISEPVLTYEYFLKGSLYFASDHIRSEEFETVEFKEKYPVKSEDYSEEDSKILKEKSLKGPKVLQVGPAKDEADNEDKEMDVTTNLLISAIGFSVLLFLAVFLRHSRRY